MKWGRSDARFDPSSIEEVGNHVLILHNWAEASALEVGDKYAMRAYFRPTPGIAIIDSSEVRVEDVTLHFAEGMGLVAQNPTNITLDSFKVATPDDSPWVFSTVADATHFFGCRGEIISKNRLYENMADDAINVHATYQRLDSILAPSEFIVSFAHEQSFGFKWYNVADSLRIIFRETLLPIATHMPTTVEVLSEKEIKITVPSPLPDIADAIAVENLSVNPSVKFTNSIVRNNRARGALFSTPKLVECTHNTFDHTHGSAILLTGDANGWYESDPCEEVIIASNHFINALTSRYQFTDGIISISPQMPRTVEGEYFHGKIAVKDNIFDIFPTPLVYAKSVRELVFKNNTINENLDYPSLFTDNTPKYINVGNVLDK